MSAMNQKATKRARWRVAHEAARIILEEGVKDYQFAKHKAVNRLGTGDRTPLPSNLEIEEALLGRQRLFYTEQDYHHQSMLWKAALAAMQFLRAFNPRLVGDVIRGTANKHTVVNLHLFAEAMEDVLFHFLNAGISYRSAERRIRFGTEVSSFPSVQYLQTEFEIEAIILPSIKLWQAPTSTIDGKPMKRAEITEVEKRVATLCTAGYPSQ